MGTSTRFQNFEGSDNSFIKRNNSDGTGLREQFKFSKISVIRNQKEEKDDDKNVRRRWIRSASSQMKDKGVRERPRIRYFIQVKVWAPLYRMSSYVGGITAFTMPTQHDSNRNLSFCFSPFSMKLRGVKKLQDLLLHYIQKPYLKKKLQVKLRNYKFYSTAS